jgi:hypothetical protein
MKKLPMDTFKKRGKKGSKSSWMECKFCWEEEW